jgi:thioredoxin-dependent peroxiredoxin
MKAIHVGDVIPDFTLRGLDGQIFEITKFRGEKQLVLIFYPPDGSNGCKNVVCKFHDITEYFDKDSFMIFGISGLSIEYLKDTTRYQELNFPIICDQDNKIRKLFGVSSFKLGKYDMLLKRALGLNPGRVTFVTDKEGKVIYETKSQDGLKCQADEALKICFHLSRTNGIDSITSKI